VEKGRKTNWVTDPTDSTNLTDRSLVHSSNR
jgi:hypothetical protein